MSTADICRQIECQVCCFDGTAYTFEVQSIALLPGSPGHAVLQVGASRRNAVGRPALTSSLRVTAAVHDLESRSGSPE